MGRPNTTLAPITEMLKKTPATIPQIISTLGLSKSGVRSCMTDHPALFVQGTGWPRLWHLRQHEQESSQADSVRSFGRTKLEAFRAHIAQWLAQNKQKGPKIITEHVVCSPGDFSSSLLYSREDS